MTAKIIKLRASMSREPGAPLPGPATAALSDSPERRAPLTPAESQIVEDLVSKYGFPRDDSRRWVTGLERRGRLDAVVYMDQATNLGIVEVSALLRKHGVLS